MTKEMVMRDKIWLLSAFLLMFILAPMLMILTATVNSQLPMGMMLLYGTPAFAIASSLMAFWYLRHEDVWVRMKYKRN
jgi:hypothetical protein